MDEIADIFDAEIAEAGVMMQGDHRPGGASRLPSLSDHHPPTVATRMKIEDGTSPPLARVDR